MARINTRPTEPDLITAMVRSMQNNGWKLIDRFTKIHIKPEVFKTAVFTEESDGNTPIEWDIPKHIHPDNIKMFRTIDGGEWQVLAEGTGYTKIPGNKLEIDGFVTPGTPFTVYIYYPDSGAGVDSKGEFEGKAPELPGGGTSGGGTSGSLGKFFEANFATHYILENNQITPDKRKSLYGMAKRMRVAVPYGMLSPLKPFLAPKEDDPLSFEIIDIGKVISGSLQLAMSRPGFTRPSIYTYMLDEYNNPDAGGDPPQHTGYTITIPGESRRVVLDAEIFKNEWYADTIGGAPKSRTTFIFPEHFQSPIVENDFRHPDIAKTMYHAEYNTLVDVGNYWPDSKVMLKGSVDEGTAIFYMQSATPPRYTGNVNPIIPIYLGEGTPLEGYERLDGDDSLLDMIFGGTVPKGPLEDVPKFDFDDTSHDKFYEPIIPIMRKLEPSMGNGIDNIIVRKAIDGSRHLAHYVSTAVAPNLMPPDRIDDVTKEKYPRAWQDALNSEYNYKFNPSSASGKVTSGEAYIMHPEAGMRGKIRNIILCNPLSILNGDILRVTNDYCADPTDPNKYDDYEYYLVDGVSPFTKKPSIHYRPMGSAFIITESDELGGDGPTSDKSTGGDEWWWSDDDMNWGDINTQPPNSEGIPPGTGGGGDSGSGGGGDGDGGSGGGGDGGDGSGGGGTDPDATKPGTIIPYDPGDDLYGISQDLLDKMKPKDVVLIVCANHRKSGEKYSAYMGLNKFASSIDVESSGKHKAIIVDSTKLQAPNSEIYVECLRNKQPFWNVFIMNYQQVQAHIDNSTAIPIESNSLAFQQIVFEDNTSIPSKVQGSETNMVHIPLSI